MKPNISTRSARELSTWRLKWPENAHSYDSFLTLVYFPSIVYFSKFCHQEIQFDKSDNIALTKLHVNNQHLILCVNDLSEIRTLYTVEAGPELSM